MKITNSDFVSAQKRHFALPVALALASLLAVPHGAAQTPSRFLGTIAAIAGDTLTTKTDAGETRQVQVPAAASIKRIEPGQKDLSTAVTIPFSDLAVGDRVLVKLDLDSSASLPQALQIVAIKQADVTARQQKDREDWQRRGVGGLVKSVDPGNGVILLTTGTGPTAKVVTVRTSKATMLKRYAPASVSYDTATQAPIDAILPGDQLRARGSKNADGSEIAAEEVVSGTFRNISGLIASIDPAASSFSIKDLATKKQITVHIPADTQMRRIPEMMARFLAARLNGTMSASGGAAMPAGASAAGSSRGGAGQWSSGGGQAGGQWRGQASGGGFGQGGASGGSDPNQMLSRLPAIKTADLKKGDAVMLVSTDGATDVTAITLLAGVEPLLEAPAASQSLLNNWSMNSGAGAADAAAQ